MKKLFGILVIAAVTFLAVSCGPSAKEIEAKRIQDSTFVADSCAKVAAAQQLVADSIAKADSIKKADSIAKLPVKKAKLGKKK